VLVKKKSLKVSLKECCLMVKMNRLEFVQEMSILIENYKIYFQAYSFQIISHLDFKILVSYVQDMCEGTHRQLAFYI
jgi:hypothetical protein